MMQHNNTLHSSKGKYPGLPIPAAHVNVPIDNVLVQPGDVHVDVHMRSNCRFSVLLSQSPYHLTDQHLSISFSSGLGGNVLLGIEYELA